jgi:hypothetical protein
VIAIAHLTLLVRLAKNDRIRQLTDYLRLVNPDYPFPSVMIHILLLPEGNLLENMVVAL